MIYDEIINWSDKEFSYSFKSEVKKVDKGEVITEIIEQGGNILRPIDKTKKYPVLYLLHGMGSAGEWQRQKIQCKLNKWIKKYNLAPMILVMPNIPKGQSKVYTGEIYKEYIEGGGLLNLVNYISNMYKEDVLNTLENTAIAGNSLGGTGALYAAILYADVFMHVGAISPGPIMYVKAGGGWINDSKKLKLNNDKSAVHFMAYSLNEGIDFKAGADEYYDAFTNNKTKITLEAIDGDGHGFGTFIPEFELFLQRKMFRCDDI